MERQGRLWRGELWGRRDALFGGGSRAAPTIERGQLPLDPPLPKCPTLSADRPSADGSAVFADRRPPVETGKRDCGVLWKGRGPQIRWFALRLLRLAFDLVNWIPQGSGMGQRFCRILDFHADCFMISL